MEGGKKEIKEKKRKEKKKSFNGNGGASIYFLYSVMNLNKPDGQSQSLLQMGYGFKNLLINHKLFNK